MDKMKFISGEIQNYKFDPETKTWKLPTQENV